MTMTEARERAPEGPPGSVDLDQVSLRPPMPWRRKVLLLLAIGGLATV